MGPNCETDPVVRDGATRLGGARSSRDIVGRRGLMEDWRRTEEGGGWLGAREGVVQVVGLMGVGVGDR